MTVISLWVKLTSHACRCIVDIHVARQTGTSCVTTDAELDHLQAILIRFAANFAADPATPAVDAATRRNSISGDARAGACRWIARGRRNRQTVGVGPAPVADYPPPTDVATISAGSTRIWSISDPACAVAGRRVAATVGDRVGAVGVVATWPGVDKTPSSNARDPAIVRSIAGHALAATLCAADRVGEHRRAVVGMSATRRVVVVVDSPSPTASAILCRLVLSSTRASAADAVASGKRVAAVGGDATVGADPATYAGRRRKVGVDCQKTGNAFAATVGAAPAAGNCVRAVVGRAAEAFDRSPHTRGSRSVVGRENVASAATPRVAVTVRDRVGTVDVPAAGRGGDPRARCVERAPRDETVVTAALSACRVAVASVDGRRAVRVPSTSGIVLVQPPTPTVAPPSPRRRVVSADDDHVTGNAATRAVDALAVGDLRTVVMCRARDRCCRHAERYSPSRALCS